MKALTKSFHFFNLGIIQSHIPSEGSVTQAVLKEMNQQFLIINHLGHFVAVCFKMSYRALSSRIFDKFWHSKLSSIHKESAIKTKTEGILAFYKRQCSCMKGNPFYK